jgi:hypothetical protein
LFPRPHRLLTVPSVSASSCSAQHRTPCPARLTPAPPPATALLRFIWSSTVSLHPGFPLPRLAQHRSSHRFPLPYPARRSPSLLHLGPAQHCLTCALHRPSGQSSPARALHRPVTAVPNSPAHAAPAPSSDPALPSLPGLTPLPGPGFRVRLRQTKHSVARLPPRPAFSAPQLRLTTVALTVFPSNLGSASSLLVRTARRSPAHHGDCHAPRPALSEASRI